ncbi:helix-turn-helix transcriptional regulator [Flavobacterium columnare]|uniref:DNA-binding protein n=1 Tax=Flavobacterium columnare TaxID=996 RepID=A0AA94JN48_9FLAO|nr:helix-turn-helix domain-containing protein [Flavobacterium columnare]MCH4830605.1 helix-turn-helix domain-containing protein [Flavobacterium columnare]MCH4833458.1 helix-turn-helix domain-containing protein [Flavobacterium columnare]
MENLLQELKDIKTSLLLQKEVLTIEEVAIYTGYTIQYIYKLVHLGIIPFSKPNGKKLFFSKEKLIEWLKSNEIKSDFELEKEAENYQRVKL